MNVTSPQKPRVAVIGSGHNALVCSCYLGRAGFDVTVFEASETLGGATTTSELAPGYRVSAASYSLGLLRPAIVSELGLKLELTRKTPAVFVPLEDDHLFIWSDDQRTAEEFQRIGERGDYAGFNALMAHAAKVFRPLLDDPTPPSVAEIERKLDAEFFELCVAGSAAATCSKFFTHDLTRGLFAGQGIVGTTASVDEDGTAWVMTYHNIAGELVDSVGAWCYVKGGMGSIATELVRVAKSFGVSFKTGSRIVGLLTQDDRASGVILEDGTEFACDLVVSGADAQTSYAIAGIAGKTLKTGAPVVKVNLAMREVPRFSCLSETDVRLNGTITINTSLTELREAFTQAQDKMSPRPWMELFVTSADDDPTLFDSFGVDSGAVASAFCQYAPRDAELDVADAQRIVVENIRRFAPDIDVVACEVLGPTQLAQRFGLPDGDIFHGDMRPPQMLSGRLTYQAPVAGLWMCGSSTHPGGAVTGACGRNAARRILNQLQT